MAASIACSARSRRGRARDHRPGLRDGVDAALVVRRRAERRAVVVVGAAVPAAVPARGLERVAQRGLVVTLPRQPDVVATALAQRGEVLEDAVEEEADPDALTASLATDAVHAVVPVARAHERQPVRAARHAVVERATAVLVERRGLRGDLGPQVGLVLPGLQRARREERHGLVQHAPVAGGVDVEGGEEGQPEEIVREARARAASRRRVPPVQHVAFDELMRGVAQELCPRDGGTQVDQRRRVLELVAEAVRAARLVERAPPPHAARQRLVAEPAVHQHVELGQGRLHLHGAEEVRPEHAGARQRGVDGSRLAIPRDQRTGRAGFGRLAQEEAQLYAAARRQRDGDLPGDAGVQRRAGAAAELADGRDGGRRLARPAVAEKLGAGRPSSARWHRPARRARRTRCRRRTRSWFDCGRGWRSTPGRTR